jgi:hypothetical protein
VIERTLQRFYLLNRAHETVDDTVPIGPVSHFKFHASREFEGNF